ncbi:hypothetical protein DFH28DRAFT_923780 [Melampsora americana]|nr:hypothetical protein DFH28DRAFT_923780 [Melampsora americana]
MSDLIFFLAEEPHLGWLDIKGVPDETLQDKNQANEYDYQVMVNTQILTNMIAVPFCAFTSKSASQFNSPDPHIFSEAHRIIGKFHKNVITNPDIPGKIKTGRITKHISQTNQPGVALKK